MKDKSVSLKIVNGDGVSGRDGGNEDGKYSECIQELLMTKEYKRPV